MKLLHTSDWHLGARLGRVDRAPDHEAALAGLHEIAEAERPDLILHTGDLFDQYRPPHDALHLGVRALARLARTAPTVALAGNHDSPGFFRALDVMAAAAEPRRLWFVSEPQVWSMPEPGGAQVVCVPFIRPGAIADYASGDLARFEGDYADGVRMLNQRLLGEAGKKAGARGVVLYAAHLHVHGAKPGKSERRITVGEDHATHLEGLDRALYCAFGHIHDPQLLPGGVARGRYAGSLIPLDFGETQQTKQAVLVSIGNDVQVEERALPGGRPLVDFSGSLEEFEARAADGGLDGCILRARVQSQEPVPDLAERLRERSPKCEVFDIRNPLTDQPVKPVDTEAAGQPEPSLKELFLEWRTNRATRVQAPHDAVAALFREALGGEDSDFGLDALRAADEENRLALKED